MSQFEFDYDDYMKWIGRVEDLEYTVKEMQEKINKLESQLNPKDPSPSAA